MKEILNILSSFRLFIGILFLAFACYVDFSGYGILTGIITCIRFMMGLFGAWCMVGNVKNGMGHIMFLVLGFLGYAFTITSEKVNLGIYLPAIDGWVKYSLRALCAIIFILGYRDVKERSL